MKKIDVALLRLNNQKISSTKFKKPEQVVSWLGGMQGQDYPGVKWSIGLRMLNGTEASIEKAIANKKIVRTWTMRGTLHFVASEDIRWQLALTAPKNLAGTASRHRQLEIDKELIVRCKDIFIKALQGGREFTRGELYDLLNKNNISTAGQRGIHIIWLTATDKLMCYGSPQGKQQTFALLDNCVPKSKELDHDEALEELAKRYFTSRGPATLQDYIWWSGLAASNARKGLEMFKSQLICEDIEGQTYWMSKDITPLSKNIPSAFALPGFDEYLLGYKDRSIQLDPKYANNTHPGNNGMFLSTIVLNGCVVGTWNRTFKKDEIIILLNAFTKFSIAEQKAILPALERYGDFMGKSINLVESRK